MSSTIYDYTDDFTSMSMPNLMKLDDSTICKFKVAKEFGEKNRVNAIDFSDDGHYMITSSDDDTIRLYNCKEGIQEKDIQSRKYGADLIKFTHAKNTAIHTSTKENDTIRYVSLHDNRYLRYFVGHDKRVVTLSMSPSEDIFISGSLDKTVRIWDMKNGSTVHKLSFPESTGAPVANYDPEGLIFAVGLDNSVLRLYDARNADKGPFSTIKYHQKGPAFKTWNSLKFSPNGKQMLITTNCEEILVLDAFSGEPLHKLTIGPAVGKPLEHPCEASYSPDSQYIISGSEDGCLHVWSSSRGNKVCILKPRRQLAEPVQCVKFNPKYMLIGSASNFMSFWNIPE